VEDQIRASFLLRAHRIAKEHEKCVENYLEAMEDTDALQGSIAIVGSWRSMAEINLRRRSEENGIGRMTAIGSGRGSSDGDRE